MGDITQLVSKASAKVTETARQGVSAVESTSQGMGTIRLSLNYDLNPNLS